MGPTVLRVGIALALVVLVAGCVDGGPVEDTVSSPTADVPTTTETPTETPTEYQYASNEPDPDHAVHLSNGWTESVEMELRVVRDATNGTVHEETYEIDAGVERTVYDVSEADPDGVESFTIRLSALGATDEVTIRTSACYGDVVGGVGEDGEVGLTYAIC